MKLNDKITATLAIDTQDWISVYMGLGLGGPLVLTLAKNLS